ncbi:MAG: VCBS repeat-containing protein [Bacteroidales bacterium]|nr:VCBS repeat-containing protein [Bacteroidales bacterium]
MKKSVVFSLLFLPSLLIAQTTGTLTDPRDGRTYQTVKIGDQWWMAENLNYGTRINSTTTVSDNGVVEKYCYNNSESNCLTYGALYPWNEMMNYSTIESAQGICPAGWHLPSDQEWKEMELVLGMSQVQADLLYEWRGTTEGTKLKSGGSSGFEGLLAGYISYYPTFEDLGSYGFFWSSSGDDSGNGYIRMLNSGQSKVQRTLYRKTDGISVRCVREVIESNFTQMNWNLNNPLGHLSSVDYDNDGDYDFLVTATEEAMWDGYENWGTRLYENTGNFNLSVVPGIDVTYNSLADWGDYDNDGDLDLIITGVSDYEFFMGFEAGNPSTTIYRNDGSNVFTKVKTNIENVCNGAVKWCDLDNDGDLDVIISGSLEFQMFVPMTFIYKNEGINAFIEVDMNITGLADGMIAINDYDKDLDSDILLIGSSHNGEKAVILRNEGDLNFTESVYDMEISRYSPNPWMDYDGDGDLDILSGGHIYRNNGDDIYTDFFSFQGSECAWGDYDNDGDLDVVSWNIYQNENNSSFNAVEDDINPSYFGSQFVDIDFDGDLDIVDNNNYFINNIISSNNPPSVPTNLQSKVYYNKIELKWDKSTDGLHSSDNITYNLQIGISTNKNSLVSSNSHDNGRRKIVNYGNVYSDTAWTIHNLDGGWYYWKVQAIDNSNFASAFSGEASLFFRSDFFSIGSLNFQGLEELYSPGWYDFDRDDDYDYRLNKYYYVNNGKGSFTEVYDPDYNVQWGFRHNHGLDLDNDGDDDDIRILEGNIYIFINENGNYDDSLNLGISTSHYSWTDFDNDYDLDILTDNVILINQGELNFVSSFNNVLYGDINDFNNDGYPDILHNENLYVNNITSFQLIRTSIGTGTGLYVDYINSDFDNDGDIDVFHNNSGNFYLFDNDGEGNFYNEKYHAHRENNGFSIDNKAVDYNNDGDVEFGGFYIDPDYGYHIPLFINNCNYENNPPQTPTNLNTTEKGDEVLFNWDSAIDDISPSQCLTYNLRIGTSPGGDEIMSALSNTSGFLTVPKKGNVQFNTGWKIKNLQPDTYYWSVQAIDQTELGGPWATEQILELGSLFVDFIYDTACLGNITRFIDQSEPRVGTISAWFWDFGDGTFSTVRNPVHQFSRGGTHIVKLKVTAGQDVDSIIKPVCVKHKPFADFTVNIVCEGTRTTFTNKSNTDSITVASWLWNFGDGDFSDVREDIQHSYLLPGNYEARLEIDATNGCTDSVIKQVIVAEMPNKAVGLDYGYPVFCKGDSAQLSAEHNDNYNYQWKLNDFNITGATTSQLKIKNTGDYSVAITNPVGNCAVESEKKTITVIPTPDPPAVSVSTLPAIICSGDSILLSSTYNSNYQYQWRLNGGTIGTDTNFYCAKSEGNYTLEVSVGDGCKSDPSAEIFVEVLSLPEKPAIEVSGATGFCEGDSVVLSVVENQGYTYRWKSDYGYISGMTGSKYTAKETGNFAIEITGNNGCKILSNPVKVISSTAPDPPAIVAEGAVSFCLGDSVELSTEYNTDYTYQWKYNDGNVGGKTNRLYARLEGAYKLEIEVAGVGECSRAVSNIINVTTLDNPEKPSINLDGPAQICSGNSVELSVPSAGEHTYQWKFNGNDLTNATASEYLAVSSGEYSIRITNIHGCSAESNPVQIVVSDPPPISQITSLSDTVICQGETVSLEVPDNPQYTYQWKLNGIPVHNATGATYNATREGLYTVEIANYNCGVTTNTKEIIFKAGLPKPSIQAYGPNAWYFVCNIDNALVYRWYYNDNLVEENDKSIYFAGTQTGEYYVEVNDGGECFVPSEKITIPVVTTGIGHLQAEHKLYLYPNPSPGSIRILYSDHYTGEIMIRISNIEGRVLDNIELYKDHADFSEEINLTGLSAGLYILEFHTNQYTLKERLLIMK